MRIEPNPEVVDDLNLTPAQVENLTTLATFLERAVPPPTFNMAVYLKAVRGSGQESWVGNYEPDEVTPETYAACGTCACAIGHGPLAGITTAADETWEAYSHRVFGLSAFTAPWDWCFSPTWRGVDNTPLGAAERIRILLEEGLPEDSNDVLYHQAPVPYVVDTPAESV